MDGKITIAPEVVLQVARITTLATPGVLALVDPNHRPSTPTSPALPRDLFRGITASVDNGQAHISLHVVAAANTSLIKLARHIQSNVASAMSEIAGIESTTVDVSFVDVRVTA